MSRYSVAQNTAFITFASITQRLISFLYFVIVIKKIPVEDAGKYTSALAFTTILVVFVDLGFTNVLVREAARAMDKVQNYFSTVLFAKFFFGAFAYGSLFILVRVLDYSSEIRTLIYISGITMFLDSLHLSIYGVLRSFGNLRYEAVGMVGSQIITLVLGVSFLYSGLPLYFLMVAFVVPSFVNVCFASASLYRRYKIKFVPRYNKEIFFYIAKIAIPFALAAIFARTYSQVDTVIILKMLGEKAAGWYGAPSKISNAFLFVPLALVASLYPRLSEYYIKDKDKLARLFEQSIKYLLIVVLPVSVGVFILVGDIIPVISAKYIPSVYPTQLLMIALVFSYLSFPIGSFLNACNKQATQTSLAGMVMVVNLSLNFILIPRLGISGAAFATIVSSAVLTFVGYFFASKITKFSHAYIIKSFFQIALAAFAMGVVVYFLRPHVHFVISILCGTAVYPLALFATRAVSIRQIKSARALIKRKV